MTSTKSSELPAVLIKASAGSGKTYRLTQRILNFVSCGVAPDTILATTFTRKASAEITSRIYELIASVYLSGDTTHSGHIEKLLSDDIQNAHVFRVATIDSLCLSIAQAFAYELGLPPRIAPATNWRQEELESQAISLLLQNGDPQTTRQLIETLSKNTGGRTVFATLERYLNQAYNLFLQAGKRGILEMPTHVPLPLQEKIEILLSGLTKLPLPKTKKGEPSKQWQNALTSGIEQLNNKMWDTFLNSKLCEAAVSGEQFYRSDVPSELANSLTELAKIARDNIAHEYYLQNKALSKLFDMYTHAREELAQRHSTFSFDDIKSQISAKSLLDDTNVVSYRLDSTYNHLLFDEFQDTSFLDWSVLRPLANEVLSSLPEGRTFFCVGDSKQSIYQWRGGLPSLFSSLEEDYAPVLSTESLDFSFRCSQSILDFVNTFFDGLPPSTSNLLLIQASKNWKSRFSPHTAKRNEKGFVSYEQIDHINKDGLFSSELLKATAETVACIVADHPSSSVGILVRNNQWMQPILSILRSPPYELKVSEEGASALEDSPVVLAFFSLFTLLDHPGDSNALYHISHTPLGKSLALKPDLSIKQLSAVLQKIRQDVSEKGFGNALCQIIQSIRSLFEPEEDTRIEQLLELGYIFEKEFEECFTEFTRFVSTESVENATTAQIRIMTVHKSKGLEFDFVVLPALDKPFQKRGSPNTFLPLVDEVTGQVTGAKILPNKEIRKFIDDGKIEESYGQHSIRAFEEELSILYVAFTRARYGLSILGHAGVEPEKQNELSPAHLTVQTLNKLTKKQDSLYLYGRRESSINSSVIAEIPYVKPHIPVPLYEASPCSLLPVIFSPSSLRKREKINVEALLSSDAQETLAVGETVHALLERISWLNPTEKKITPHSIASSMPHSLQALQIVQQAFLATKFSELFYTSTFGDQNSLHLWREHRFAVPQDQIILTGTFDRVVLKAHPEDPFLESAVKEAWIIDFKTAPKTEEFAVFCEQYRPQLEMYKQALNEILGKHTPPIIHLILALLPSGTILSL